MDNFKTIDKEVKGRRLDTLEALEMNKYLLNEQLDLNSSPILKFPLNFTF
jgi:hypothetical protein